MFDLPQANVNRMTVLLGTGNEAGISIEEARYRRTHPAKRSKRGRHASEHKKTISSTLREYGLPESLIRSHRVRYKNPLEKGILWYYTSLYVRHRDVKEWGICISCGAPITVETCDAGHFIPAAGCGPELLFDLTNIHAECSHCNAWDEMHLIYYAKNLDLRYGKGTSSSLLLKYELIKDTRAKNILIKDPPREEYIRQIANIRALLTHYVSPTM